MRYSKKLISAAFFLNLAIPAGLLLAQDTNAAPPASTPSAPPPVTGGWRRVTDLPPAQQPAPAPDPDSTESQQWPDPGQAPPQGPPPPTYQNPGYQNAPPQNPGYQNPGYQNQPNYPPQNQSGYPQNQAPPPVPAQLTIKPGTYVTVRVNQPLSSDHNQVGDAFTASLVQPVVVDGVVVAQRGQTIYGHVTEAKKAGRVEGTSRLGLQLTQLTLVDGQQLPIHSEMIGRSGPTSVGRDVAAVGGTTALGAAVGAAADWGRGAAIGAGAGAAAGILGVLLTRGQPTVVFPESVLTFRIEQPVLVSTEHAPDAFRYVDPNDYNGPPSYQGRPGPGGPAPYGRYGYAAPPPAPYYGYAAPYPYYPFGFYFGPRAYWGGIYIGRSYYGRGYYGRGYYGGRHR